MKAANHNTKEEELYNNFFYRPDSICFQCASSNLCTNQFRVLVLVVVVVLPLSILHATPRCGSRGILYRSNRPVRWSTFTYKWAPANQTPIFYSIGSYLTLTEINLRLHSVHSFNGILNTRSQRCTAWLFNTPSHLKALQLFPIT